MSTESSLLGRTANGGYSFNNSGGFFFNESEIAFEVFNYRKVESPNVEFNEFERIVTSVLHKRYESMGSHWLTRTVACELELRVLNCVACTLRISIPDQTVFEKTTLACSSVD